MKTIILLAVCLLQIACGSSKKVQDAITITSQTNKEIEVRYEKVFIEDTVFIEIPAQTSQKETSDKESNLENDYASSKARINPDGTLYHDLKTKPQKKPVPIKFPVERKDSLIYIDRITEVPKCIERNLSWWEQTCIKWFPYSIGVLLISLCTLFRKPIFAFVRRFI